MTTIKTTSGQSLIDIALIYTGIPDNATPIAIANNINPDASLAPGTTLVIPSDIPTDVRTVNFFRSYARPASDPHILPGGSRATYGTIGTMTVGVNFIV